MMYRLISLSKRTKKVHFGPFIYTEEQADKRLRRFTLCKGVITKFKCPHHPIECRWNDRWSKEVGEQFDQRVNRAERAWARLAKGGDLFNIEQLPTWAELMLNGSVSKPQPDTKCPSQIKT